MELLFSLEAIVSGMGMFAIIFGGILVGGLVLSILFEKFELIALLTGALLVAMFFYDPTYALLAQAAYNWDSLLVYIIGWFVVGGAWSVFKLWRYSASLSTAFESFQSEKLKGLDVTKMCPRAKSELVQEISNYMRCHTKYGEIYPTRLSNIKGVITGWIMYWPISAVLYVVDEPIKRVLIYVYERLGKVYSRIIDRHTESYRKQMSELQ